jgi:hypothetical protein
MKKLLFLVAILVGGAMVVRRVLPPEQRESISHLGETMGERMMERMMGRMERMMEEMPDDSPPKLVMSILPRVQEQNEQILALLREQNELLRQRPPASESK